MKKVFDFAAYLSFSTLLYSTVYVVSLVILPAGAKGMAAMGLLAFFAGTTYFASKMETYNREVSGRPVKVEVFVRDLFGGNWTANVLLHRDGTLTAPEKAEERILTPYGGLPLTETFLGFPRYDKKWKVAGKAHVAVGVLMLERLYTLPVDYGHDETNNISA